MRASAALLSLPLLQLVLANFVAIVSGGDGSSLAPTENQVDDTSGARLGPSELFSSVARDKTTQLAASIPTKLTIKNNKERVADEGQENEGQESLTADKALLASTGTDQPTTNGEQVIFRGNDWRFKRRTTLPAGETLNGPDDGLIAKARRKTTFNATTRGGGGGGETKRKQKPRDELPARLAMTSIKQPAGGAIYDRTTTTTETTEQQQDYLTRLYLDTNVPLEVQTHVGDIAYLMCRLRAFQQQGQHLSVSWVRNMQILTTGELRYTSDERFRPTHLPGTQDWVLEVHNVNTNDEGVYECQVNSEPKTASVSLYLHVMTATMEILESPQVQVGEDEQIRLTCRVEFSSQAQQSMETDDRNSTNNDETTTEIPVTPTTALASPMTKFSGALSSQHYIYWYKDNISLEYNNQRGGIRVERRDNASILESVLTVEGASSSDSGTYLCRIVPELNEVPIAQTQVLVGGASSSSSSMTGSRRHRAGHNDQFVNMIVSMKAIFPLLIAILTEQLTRCGPAAEA